MFRGEPDEEMVGRGDCPKLVEGWTTDDDIVCRGAVYHKELYRGSHLFRVCPDFDDEGN